MLQRLSWPACLGTSVAYLGKYDDKDVPLCQSGNAAWADLVKNQRNSKIFYSILHLVSELMLSY